MNKKALIESALFVSNSPLSLKKLCQISNLEEEEVKKILEEMRDELSKEDRGIELVETPAGYELRIKPEYRPLVASLAPFSDLSDGMMRTLAIIISYGKPITQSLIVRYQGNKAYDYIKQLENKGLVKTEKFGRTKLVKLTKDFERYFGMSIEEIKKKIEERLKEIKD